MDTADTRPLIVDQPDENLADYRRHYPIDSVTPHTLIAGPRTGFLARVRRWPSALFRFCFGRRQAGTSEKRPDHV
jgi:hypothetical protein